MLPRLALCIFAYASVVVTCELTANVPYRVNFEGNLDPSAKEAAEGASQLLLLKKSTPPTKAALERRARSDVNYILQGLHSLALYNAEVDIEVDTESSPALVTVTVDQGNPFTIRQIHILPSSALPPVKSNRDEPDEEEEDEYEAGRLFMQNNFLNVKVSEVGLFEEEEWGDEEIQWVEVEKSENPSSSEIDLSAIQPEHLGITLDEPAYPSRIIQAEDELLHSLNCWGFPLARLMKRKVVADQSNETVEVWYYVNVGPQARMAEPKISGNQRVKRSFIRKKVEWHAGDLYTPRRINCTLDQLERTGLFRCVNIQLGDELDTDGQLPIHISVNEVKHRTAGAGLTYSTERGAGFIGEWENRNFRGLGQHLRIETELLRKTQQGIASYRIPDFYCRNMDLLHQLELEREITDSFRETALTFSTRVHRRWTSCLQTWIGTAFKYTFSTDSDNDRRFNLVKIPMQLRYNTADDLLDPTYGYSLNLKCTPTFQFLQPALTYYISTLDMATYVPVDKKKCWVFAGKLSLGTIWGASRQDIPPPERFYAGSPTLLRGYRYLTVSPLDANNKPLGGRSLMVVSMEVRRRLSETWGIVGFWDIGNVYDTLGPRFNHPQLQSVGVGLRYYTPVGPLRLDVAHPLDRRSGLDNPVQVYFSIGQTF